MPSFIILYTLSSGQSCFSSIYYILTDELNIFIAASKIWRVLHTDISS